MPENTSTYWTLIRRAARGSREARSEFARRYDHVIRSYLAARWRGTPLFSEAEDAVQEVFVDCFKEHGALGRVEAGRPGGFRAYLFGIVRNTALVFERKRARRRAKPTDESFRAGEISADEASLATVFDRAWATAMLRQAGARQEELARETGDAAARRRVKLLNLRFHEGLPIREIAAKWDEDPRHLHREYAKARDEFLAALLDVVSWHHPGPRRQAELECSRILDCFA